MINHKSFELACKILCSSRMNYHARNKEETYRIFLLEQEVIKWRLKLEHAEIKAQEEKEKLEAERERLRLKPEQGSLF